MVYSQAKVEAHKKIEEAIQDLVNAYKEDRSCEDHQEGWITTGWLLVTNEIRSLDKEEIDSNPVCDEVDFAYTSGCYSRRGQEPVLTLGLAHEYIRHYHSVNE